MQESVKQDREKYLGGSDIGVIMNLSPFKSRFDLLLEKAGYKEDTFEGNVYTEYGNTLEPKIRDYVNATYKAEDFTPFVEGKHTREATEDEIIGVRIHTDGENGAYILEIKTTSTIYESVDDYKLYLVQLIFYMVNTGKPYGLLAVYNRPENLDETFNPERLQLFDIKLKDYEALVGEISEACESFIADLSKVKANPFITEEELLPSDITEISKRILAFESQIKYMKNILVTGASGLLGSHIVKHLQKMHCHIINTLYHNSTFCFHTNWNFIFTDFLNRFHDFLIIYLFFLLFAIFLIKTIDNLTFF